MQPSVSWPLRLKGIYFKAVTPVTESDATLGELAITVKKAYFKAVTPVTESDATLGELAIMAKKA
jgi:hypothetical protein